MKVTGPPEHLLNEMKQQLELATTKCGSLQQELELIKDKVRKSSSQSVIKVEDNDEPEIEESDKNSISGDFPMGSEFDNEVRKFFLEMPNESHRPLSASSDSSDVKSTKSKQDIINIFFKRLETMENKEENSEPSVESKLTYDIDNSIIDDFEDVGEFFSSFQNEENDEKVETKTNIENLKMKYKEDEKIETLIKKSLSKIKLTKIKSSKNLKNTSQKKKISKHVVPVNDVINYMKKNPKREKMTKSTIRSVNRKETDFIKKNLIMNPKIKKSKSTVSAPLMGQNARKISNAILPTEKKVEKIPPPPPPPPLPSEKVEPDKKIELEKKAKEPEKPKMEPEKKPKIEIDKKTKVENDKKPELVTSLVEKLSNVKKHQEQRSLITIPEKKLIKPEKKAKVEEKIELEKKALKINDRKNESKGKIETKVEEKIELEKKTPKILNERKNEFKGKIETKVEQKMELEKKTQPKINDRKIEFKGKIETKVEQKIEPEKKTQPKINDRKNESKLKIESKLPVKIQKSNSKVNESESKIKNEVVKKVTLFESKNLQKAELKMPKIDRKVSTMKEIFQPKMDEIKGVQSLHSRVGSTLMQKMSKTTFNGENPIKSLVLPSLKKEKNFEKFSKIPFIVGQSTTKSYHIGLNIQQTLSLFKLTPSLTSLCDNETKLERSPAYTILVTPERKMKKPCAACVNPQESDEEENGDPWSITDKIQSDQRSRQFSQCSCLPGKLMSFHQVLSQMFQPENTKMFNNYQTEEDSAESQKSCATYRENNAFHHLKLLRKIQKLQETFEKS